MTDWLEWVLEMGAEEADREDADEDLTGWGRSHAPIRTPVPGGPSSRGEDGAPSEGRDTSPSVGEDGAPSGGRDTSFSGGTDGSPVGGRGDLSAQEGGRREEDPAWGEETGETMLGGSRPPGRAFSAGNSSSRETERGGEDLAWGGEGGTVWLNRKPLLPRPAGRAGTLGREAGASGGNWRRYGDPEEALPARAGGAGELLERARRTRAAAEYAAGRREPVAVPVPVATQSGGHGLGAGELDRVFQRDARRFDGAFTLY